MVDRVAWTVYYFECLQWLCAIFESSRLWQRRHVINNLCLDVHPLHTKFLFFPLRVWSYSCFFGVGCMLTLLFINNNQIQKQLTNHHQQSKSEGGESKKKTYRKSNGSKEEKKEKRGKRDSEDGRVAGKQGSRRATSLLNLFTSSSSSSPNAQGRFLSLTLSHNLSISLRLSFTLRIFFSKQLQKWLWHTAPFFFVSSRRAITHAKQKQKQTLFVFKAIHSISWASTTFVLFIKVQFFTKFLKKNPSQPLWVLPSAPSLYLRMQLE